MIAARRAHPNAGVIVNPAKPHSCSGQQECHPAKDKQATRRELMDKIGWDQFLKLPSKQ